MADPNPKKIAAMRGHAVPRKNELINIANINPSSKSGSTINDKKLGFVTSKDAPANPRSKELPGFWVVD